MRRAFGARNGGNRGLGGEGFGWRGGFAGGDEDGGGVVELVETAGLVVEHVGEVGDVLLDAVLVFGHEHAAEEVDVRGAFDAACGVVCESLLKVWRNGGFEAVGVDGERVLVRQHEAGFGELGVFEDAQQRAVGFEFVAAVVVDHDWVGVASACDDEVAGRGVDDAVDGGCEASFAEAVVAEATVHHREDFAWAGDAADAGGFALGLVQRVGEDHGEERGGDAVAHRVGHEECDVLVGEGAKAVNVAGDEVHRAVEDREVEAGHVGDGCAGEVALHARGHVHFGVEHFHLIAQAGLAAVRDGGFACERFDGGLAFAEGEGHRGDGGVWGVAGEEEHAVLLEHGPVCGILHQDDGGEVGVVKRFDQAIDEVFDQLRLGRINDHCNDQSGEIFAGEEAGGVLDGLDDLVEAEVVAGGAARAGPCIEDGASPGGC